MSNQENGASEQEKPATKSKPAVASRVSMTPEEAVKLGLDPKPYGNPSAKK